MTVEPIKKIVIVGGGTAGWMAAAALSEHFKDRPLEMVLIESDDIGTVGVGEATVPAIRLFNFQLKIAELDFIKATQATFKLGIEFKDWYRQGTSFFHPFADYGVPLGGQDFYQCWLSLHKSGYPIKLEEFCLAIQMARQNRFAQPDEKTTTQLARYNYAYHFDATLYAQFLRGYAEQRAVTRIEGKVLQVNCDASSGFIKSVTVDKAGLVTGDLFIDCSGFKGLLIEQAMATGYEDWSCWLPCDAAVAMQTTNAEAPSPYTRSSALAAGWQWKIPLQHRTGNGYVFCSNYIDEQEAIETLERNVSGDPLTRARVIKFTTGVRKKFWNKNCVALGLASGFLEPLESTSISLIQTGIQKFIQFCPDLEFDTKKIAEANRLNLIEYERIRDFIILHYKASERTDTQFWRDVRVMDIPDSLARKLAAFKGAGTLLNYELETFQNASWISMYNGFNIVPDKCMSIDSPDNLRQQLEKMRHAISLGAAYAPLHVDFLQTLD